jgi:hypothetical protein
MSKPRGGTAFIEDILVLEFLAFSGIFGHFWAFLALNATFGIEDILFLPVSRPSVKAVADHFSVFIRCNFCNRKHLRSLLDYKSKHVLTDV